MKKENKKNVGGKNKITVHVSYKTRTPHKPTVVHRNEKKYTRKGKQRDRRRRDLLRELDE